MRKLSVLFFLTVIVLAQFGCTDNNNKTEKQFAEFVFNTFKNNDYSTLEKYIINMSDVENLIANSTMSSKKKARQKNRSEKYISRLNEKVKKKFNSIREDAEDVGVNWGKAKFVREDLEKEKIRDGVLQRDIHIIFESGGKEYDIELDDCMKPKRGWVLADDPRWRQNKRHYENSINK